MSQRIFQTSPKPWPKWLYAGFATTVASLIFCSSSAQAQTNISPPADPFNYAACIPTIVPDSLVGAFQLNSYLSTTGFIANPKNSKDIVALIGLDNITLPGYFPTTPGIIPFAYSKNGGRSWGYSNIPLAPCQGGDVSQTGAGEAIAFSKKGHSLYATGIFYDTNVLPGRDYILSGKWVSVSHNKGRSWSPATVLWSAPGGLNESFTGSTVNGGAGLATDLYKSRRAYCVFCDAEAPDYYYGNILATKTTNGGRSWYEAKTIYDMALDPRFLADHLDTDFPRAGGQSIAPTLLAVPGSHHNTILVAAFMRFYPAPGSDTYTQNEYPSGVPGDSLTDHAVIRSYDGGNSWETEATEISQFNFAPSHNPTTAATLGVFILDESLDVQLAYSPKTGRIYAAWQGSSTVPSLPDNPVVSPDLIQCSVSTDIGSTWSSPAQVNTPITNTNPGANQAFNVNVAVTKNGYVGFIYYDFRNYDGSSTVATDVWLDIYQEVADPTGGSTGIGLDFVKEVRLTPESFDASIGFDSIINGAGGSPGIIARGNEFLTYFSETGTDNLATETVDGQTVDPNNRFNIFVETATVK